MILKLKNDAFSLFILLIPRSLFFQISTLTPFMLPDCSKLAINRKKWRHNCWYNVFVNFLDVVVFLILSLLTCLSFMSISLLVMELWQFSFIRDWSEIWEIEISCLIFGRNLKTGASLGCQNWQEYIRVKKKVLYNVAIRLYYSKVKWATFYSCCFYVYCLQ